MSNFGDKEKRKWGPLKTQYYDEVIRLYFERHYGYKRIAKILPVGRTTILEWVHEYLKIHPELKSEMKGNKREQEEAQIFEPDDTVRSKTQKIFEKLKKQIGKLTRELKNSDSSEVEDLEKVIEELERHFKACERDLDDARVLGALESEMINIAEARYRIRIRKKPGAKQ